jgi:LmbE family N-acetylglucosaminyl deacetylase
VTTAPLTESVLRLVARRALPRYARAALRLHLALLRSGTSARKTEPPRGRITVLAPHPDDDVLGCGGTLHRSVVAGGRVTVVYVTDGSKGYARPLPAGVDAREHEERLRERREREARRAGERLGFEPPIFLGLPDENLDLGRSSVERLAEALRRVQPEVVCLPFLTESHADHWLTSRLFLAASRPAGLPRDLPCWGYEVWTPLVANAVVDITEAIAAKTEAIREFESQLTEEDYGRAILGLNTYRSLRTDRGAGFAEAFYVADVEVYRRLHQVMVGRRRSVRSGGPRF